MTPKRVLIVEDENVSRKLLATMVDSLGYVVYTAANGKEAEEEYNKDPFAVVITDIEMPVVDGNELINYINKQDEDTVIIVQTAHTALEQVIETMKLGVYDYILKPVKKEDMSYKLKRAFEHHELKKTKRILEKEKLLQAETKLDWLTWSEGLMKRDYDRIDRALFKSLHTNFNQGAGFGTLLTLIKIISQSAKEENGKYVIDKQIFETINESAILAERALDTFSEINEIISSQFDLKKQSLDQLHVFLQSIIKGVAKYCHIKEQKILISENKPHFKNLFVAYDNDFLSRATTELLNNALKFSKQKSKIMLILDTREPNAVISVINEPIKNDKGIVGIPMEYENLIFEPFFRLDSHVYEEFDTIDYGLGLTKVDKIVSKLNGTVSFLNIKDLSDLTREPVTKINFSISLPLIQ